jgi:RHS repeat-associated protein
LTNMKFNAPDPTIENPTTFEKEKAIKYDHLHNILNIVENFNGQTKTITTDIPENSVYSKLNQYASFDQWGLGYDKKGNTTQRGTQQLAYDYRNQLVTAADTPSNTQVEMKYDVLGRRTQKSVTIGSQTKIENYYHSGHQVIEVRDGNDQLLRQFIYGNGIDEIIRMDKFEGDTFTSYYYHTDANGSVTAITDANGQLVERVTYDIYGMPTFWDATGNKISKSSIGNNILFHGREYDAELNLYYFRARYYCPIMGRFLQNDPMGYQDSLNLYQGLNMNPYNFRDPFGEFAFRIKTGDGQYLDTGSGSWGSYKREEDGYPVYVDENTIEYIDFNDISNKEIRYGSRTLFVIDKLNEWNSGYRIEITLEEAFLIANMVNICLDFVPVLGTIKGIVEAIQGEDIIGNKLSWWERILQVPGVTDVIVGSYKVIVKSSKHMDVVLDIRKLDELVDIADEVSDVTKSNAVRRNSAGQLINEKGQFLSGAGGESIKTIKGRDAHDVFDELVKNKTDWQSKPRIKDAEGNVYIPDALSPSGKPVELKPRTASGIKRGRRAIKRYKKVTGKNGRVVYYDVD